MKHTAFRVFIFGKVCLDLQDPTDRKVVKSLPLLLSHRLGWIRHFPVQLVHHNLRMSLRVKLTSSSRVVWKFVFRSATNGDCPSDA